MKNIHIYFFKSGNQMCSIANPGEIKKVFVFAFCEQKKTEVISIFLIRSNPSHRVVLCILARWGWSTLWAQQPNIDSKGVRISSSSLESELTSTATVSGTTLSALGTCWLEINLAVMDLAQLFLSWVICTHSGWSKVYQMGTLRWSLSPSHFQEQPFQWRAQQATKKASISLDLTVNAFLL